MKRIALAIVLAVLSVFCLGESVVEGHGAPKSEQKVQCQCWAATQSGMRCKRRARPGERYCKQHSSSITPKRMPVQCQSMTDSGRQCTNQPFEKKRYCQWHL